MKIFASLSLAGVLLLTGCKKDEVTTPPVFERSYLHVVCAASQANSTARLVFDYYNADDVVVDNFGFGRNFPITGYADLIASGTPDEFGNGKLYYTLSQQAAINLPVDTLLKSRTTVLNANEYASLFIFDSAATLGTLKIKDEIPMDFAPGSGRLRFLNLMDGSGPVTFVGTSNSDTVSVTGTDFTQVSPFVEPKADTYAFKVLNASGAVIASLNTIYLYEGANYTFYVANGVIGYHRN